jgi:hypothetical protein
MLSHQVDLRIIYARLSKIQDSPLLRSIGDWIVDLSQERFDAFFGSRGVEDNGCGPGFLVGLNRLDAGQIA